MAPIEPGFRVYRAESGQPKGTKRGSGKDTVEATTSHSGTATSRLSLNTSCGVDVVEGACPALWLSRSISVRPLDLLDFHPEPEDSSDILLSPGN